MTNVLTLYPPKPKFEKTIAVTGEPEAVVVTVEDDSSLIILEIKGDGRPTEQLEIFEPREARKIAISLIKAADRVDRLWDRSRRRS